MTVYDSVSLGQLGSAIVCHPLVVAPHTMVRDAIGMMDDTHSSYVLVVESEAAGSRLVGILTSGDLVSLSRQMASVEQLPIQAVMSHPVISVRESVLTDDLSEVLALFRQHRIRHLPVLGAGEQIIGLLTPDALVESLITELSQLKCHKSDERQQVDSLLQENEQRYASIAKAVPVGIFRTDAEGHCYYVNDRWCQIVGITPEAASGMGWQQGLHADDRDHVFAEWQKSTQEQRSFQLEYRFQRPDGKVTWVYGQSEAERGVDNCIIGYAGTITDITDRKQAEQQLQNLIAGTAATTGQKFFPALVRHISEALNVSHVMVTEKRGEELHVLAFWANGMLQPSFTFAAPQTPCEQSLQKGLYYCESLVQQQFPADLHLIEMGVQSYLGIALQDIDGQAIGNLCILDRKPIDNPKKAENLLRVFVARAAAELERERVSHSLVLLNQELEQRVRARTAALYESEHRYRRLVEEGNDLIWSSTPNGIFTYLSPQFKSLFGWEPSEWIGKSMAQLLHPDDLSIVMADKNNIHAAGKSKNPEVRHRHRDGHYVWVRISATAIMNSLGELIGQQGIVTDISERKEYEHRLEQSNAELMRATRLKDEFLANMSHELRTPLNAILGQSESLQEEIFGPINQRQNQAISMIEQSGQHLLALINDILEVSKIEAGQLDLEITTVLVKDLCSSSLALVKPQALKKQIQLITHLPPNLKNLDVDERRIRQVLINLLNNAVKFTPAGGQVTLTISIEEPVFPNSPAFIVFAVMDTGIGIAPADQSKLFQPFVQIDSSLNRQYEGTGLGLTLVKQIVELHGGSVSLTSAVGQGSCFTIRLPYQFSGGESLMMPMLTNDSERIQNSTSLDALNPLVSSPLNENPLILLAEDNQDNIDTLSVYLEVQDYRLIIARNGQEAIDLTQTHSPDLILMDIQMPEVDGLEAIQLIRQDAQGSRVPIIALTALAMEGDREKCLAAGANEYLTKPVKMKQLLSTIQRFMACPSGDLDQN